MKPLLFASLIAFPVLLLPTVPNETHAQGSPGQPTQNPKTIFHVLERSGIESVPHTANPTNDGKATGIVSAKSPAAIADEGAGDLNRLITRLALDQIPHNFTEDKDWGGQDRRWEGVRVERDGIRLRTHRKWKMVNHGTWKKYSVQLVEPDEFAIALENLHEVREGTAGFDLHFAAKLDLSARQSQWSKGLQIYSVSAEGHATVRLVVSFEMAMKLDFATLPPGIEFSPVAKKADLFVDEFRIDRISNVGGEVAQQISRHVQGRLDEKIESKKQKLLDKINEAIEKNSDKLKLSSSQISSKWLHKIKPFLNPSRRSAADAKQSAR